MKNDFKKVVIFMNFDELVWDIQSRELYINYLISLKDEKYKVFHSNIANTKLDIIGIRVPIMRKIANSISKSKNVSSYLSKVDCSYYETLMIYGLVLSKCEEEYIKTYLQLFIDKIDNWAICDSFCSNMKFINKKSGKYWVYFTSMIDIDKEFQTRVSIVVMMNYYLNDDYIDRVLYIVSNLKTEYYYVNMAISWLLSVAIINYKDKVLNILESRKLSKFVHNKTISKICDSYRIDKDLKLYVKNLRM